jgi:PadR family transcriptional regulator PadR
LLRNPQLYKGTLSTVILKLLKENGRMYGYEITQKVKESTKGGVTINEGALYPILHKLEAEGLLSVEMERFRNRPRKYYSLTPNGGAEVVVRLDELEQFIKNMQLLLQPKLAI